MESLWSTEKIQSVLPHRYPFLFIDRVLEINKQEKKVVCLKNVSITEYFFKGHFPDKPVMPGVIIIEALAQASIVLYASLKPDEAKKHPDYFLGKVESRFKKPVFPGDKLILEIYGEKLLNTAGIGKAYAKVNDAVVTEARITFGVKHK
jgi:3-hydroxyacyl-[acyl-carrier-protein] dehydratase